MKKLISIIGFLLLSLACAAPARAAATFIQSNENFCAGAGSCSVTFGSAIGSGHLIYGMVRQDYGGGGSAGLCNVAPDPTNTQTFSDSAGSTYSTLTAFNPGPCSQFFYTQSSGAGGGTTVTVANCNSDCSISAKEWSGMVTSGGPDCSSTWANNPGSTSMTSSACTPTAASTLVIGVFAVNGAPTFTVGTDGVVGHTMTNRSAGSTSALVEDLAESSAAAYGALGSLSGSQAWNAQTVVFDVAVGGGTSKGFPSVL